MEFYETRRYYKFVNQIIFKDSFNSEGVFPVCFFIKMLKLDGLSKL